MILVYSTLLFCLGTLKFFIGRRVAGLEKRYARTAAEADKLLLAEAAAQQGHSSHKLGTGECLKRHYLLGQLVQKRDALEDKHHKWLAIADRFGTGLARVRSWQGRKLPYTMGVLDVSGVLYLIDRYGLRDQVDLQQLLDWAHTVVLK